MILPEHLQHFSRPTLIVVADHIQAKLWLAGGDALEEVESVGLPRERSTDNEASFGNGTTHAANGPEPKIEQERLHHFAKMVSTAIEKLNAKQPLERINLVMSHEVLTALKPQLSHAIAALVKKEIPKDLVKDDILDVVKQVLTV